MHPSRGCLLHCLLEGSEAHKRAESVQTAELQFLRLPSPKASLEACVFALKIGPEKTHQILIFVSQFTHERCRHSLQLVEAK